MEINVRVVRRVLKKLYACDAKRDEFCRMVKELGFKRAYYEVVKRANQHDSFTAKASHHRPPCGYGDGQYQWEPIDVNMVIARLINRTMIRGKRRLEYDNRPTEVVEVPPVSAIEERVERLLATPRRYRNFAEYYKTL